MTAFRYQELKRNPGLIPFLTEVERKEFNETLKWEARPNAAKRAVKTKRRIYTKWPTRRKDHEKRLT